MRSLSSKADDYLLGAREYLSALEILMKNEEPVRIDNPKALLACHCCELLFKAMLGYKGQHAPHGQKGHDLFKLASLVQSVGWSINGDVQMLLENHALDHAAHGNRYSPIFSGSDAYQRQELNGLTILSYKKVDSKEDWASTFGNDENVREYWPDIFLVQNRFGKITSIQARAIKYERHGLRTHGYISKNMVEGLRAQLLMVVDQDISKDAA